MARAECSLTRARRENHRRNDRAARLAATFAHRRSSIVDGGIRYLAAGKYARIDGARMHAAREGGREKADKQTKRRKGKSSTCLLSGKQRRSSTCRGTQPAARRAPCRVCTRPLPSEPPLRRVASAFSTQRGGFAETVVWPVAYPSAVVDAEGRIVVDIDCEETLALCIIDKSSGPRRGLISRSRGAYRSGSVETSALPA